MFICEICKKVPATVHLTDIHDGQKKELHMCEACAEKQGINLKQDLSLSDLLAGITKVHRQEPAPPDPKCEHCGLAFSGFQQRGRLGCAQDYRVFRSELMPIIERIHGRVRHTGKTPGESGADDTVRRELVQLNRQLRDAVEREAYEEAAVLRDRINALRENQEPDGNGS